MLGMPLRLVAQLPQRLVKVALETGERHVGSASDCEICLPHPTVSRHHALVRVSGDEATIEDLGSSNGTRVDSRQLDGPTRLQAGSRLAFGSVAAWVETVKAGDLQPAVSLSPQPSVTPQKPSAVRGSTTLSVHSLEDFALRHLPQALDNLRARKPVLEVAQQLGAMLFRAFPCLEVEIVELRKSGRAVWFEARSQREVTAGRVSRRDADLEICASFFPPSLAQTYAPVVESVLSLLALARRSDAPPPPRTPPATPPMPAPPSLEPAIRTLYRRAAQVALGDVGVLIQGESGTGKEVLARYLHLASGRPEPLFVALNCAALPRDLLEVELFGIEQAVATGVDARPGKFEQADGGTLFLDEIGDMALETQAKILRVLQEQEVFRLGARQPRSARVRVLAATNRDIETMVSAGSFRADLYHRIAGWVVELPPLRERQSDITNLASHFLAKEAERRGVDLAGISRSALDALLAWHWPGNIRELQREMASSSLFLGEGELLESSHLRPALVQDIEGSRPTLKQILDRTEQRHIEQALAAESGDTAAAADRLGIGRSTLYRRMKALGLQESG